MNAHSVPSTMLVVTGRQVSDGDWVSAFEEFPASQGERHINNMEQEKSVQRAIKTQEREHFCLGRQEKVTGRK